MGNEIKTNFSMKRDNDDKSFNQLIQDLSSNFKKIRDKFTGSIDTNLFSKGKIINFTAVAGASNQAQAHGVENPTGAIVIKNDAFNESALIMVWELTSTQLTVRNGDPFGVPHDIRVLVF